MACPQCMGVVLKACGSALNPDQRMAQQSSWRRPGGLRAGATHGLAVLMPTQPSSNVACVAGGQQSMVRQAVHQRAGHNISFCRPPHCIAGSLATARSQDRACAASGRLGPAWQAAHRRAYAA